MGPNTGSFKEKVAKKWIFAILARIQMCILEADTGFGFSMSENPRVQKISSKGALEPEILGFLSFFYRFPYKNVAKFE